MIKGIKLADIIIGDRKRGIDNEKVAELAESIKEHKLFNNIIISSDNKLIAGYHRYKALELLNFDTIEVNVMEADELDQELIEIDENLIRKELSDLERAVQLKRKKELYELKYPDTKKGISQAKALHKKADVTAESALTQDNPIQKSFIQDTSSKTGISTRSLFKDLQIATNLSDEVKELIRDNPIIDKKTKLLELAKLPRKKQIESAMSMIQGDVLAINNDNSSAPAGKLDSDALENLFEKLKVEIIQKNYEAVLTYDNIVSVIGNSKEHTDKLDEIKPLILSILLNNFHLDNIRKMLNLGLNPFLLPKLFKQGKAKIQDELMKKLEDYDTKEDEDKTEFKHILYLQHLLDQSEYEEACNQYFELKIKVKG